MGHYYTSNFNLLLSLQSSVKRYSTVYIVLDGKQLLLSVHMTINIKNGSKSNTNSSTSNTIFPSNLNHVKQFCVC